MARCKTIPLRETLCKMFPSARLRELARESGAVQRERKVDVVALFWTLVLGFGVGEKRTLAGLRRAYQRATGQELEESSFYNRFTGGLVGMLKGACEEGLANMAGTARSLTGPLSAFRDLILTDATVMRLKDLLADAFPACRTNHTRAALKLHAVMSVTGAGRRSVKLTAERRHENRVLTAGPWMRGMLLLFDLGYYDFALFARIHAHGGYFLTRLKRNANPLITALYRTHRGRAIELIGRKLQDVLAELRRETLDVEVQVAFARRGYAGQRRRESLRLRVVGIKDAVSGDYHLYLTNIPPEKLEASDIRAVYAARWQVELLFKELKSTYRIDELPSQRRAVVEALIYAAILTFTVSRRLLAAVSAKLKHLTERLPAQRWARVFAAVAQDLLFLLLHPPRHAPLIARGVVAMLLHEAPDPNLNRPSLIRAIELRRHAYRPRPA